MAGYVDAFVTALKFGSDLLGLLPSKAEKAADVQSAIKAVNDEKPIEEPWFVTHPQALAPHFGTDFTAPKE